MGSGPTHGGFGNNNVITGELFLNYLGQQSNQSNQSNYSGNHQRHQRTPRQRPDDRFKNRGRINSNNHHSDDKFSDSGSDIIKTNINRDNGLMQLGSPQMSNLSFKQSQPIK